MRRPIDMDPNQTPPHDPEVIDAMRPFLETGIEAPARVVADAAARRA